MHHLFIRNGSSLRLKLSRVVIGLSLLLFSVTLHAREIRFDTPVVSRGYDFGHDRPLNVGDTFRTDQLPLWASTVLHSAPPDKKVTITLYYWHPTDGFSTLYEEEVFVTDTKPLVLRISTEKADAFPATDYLVEFKTSGAPPASTRFRLTQGKLSDIPTKPRSYPSYKEDEATLRKFLDRYPSMRSLVSSLYIYREDSPDGQLSLILPTAWNRYAVSTPMRMHYRGEEGSLTLTAICIDPAHRKKFTPEQILKIHSALLIGRDRLVYPPKILNISPKEAYLRFAIRQKGEGTRLQRYMVFHYKNGTMTILSVEVPVASAKMGEFLSSLSVASLWTSPALCRKKDANSAKSVPPTRHCPKPSFSQDKRLIDQLIRNNPSIARRLSAFPVQRFEDPQSGISMILPFGWKKNLHPDSETIISLKGKEGGNFEYDMELRRIEDEETFKKFGSAKSLVKIYGDMALSSMEGEFKKEGISMRVSQSTQPLSCSVGMCSYAYVLASKNGERFLITLMNAYDGHDLYLITIATDDPDPTLANLLLSFGLYTLSTPNRCR